MDGGGWMSESVTGRLERSIIQAKSLKCCLNVLRTTKRDLYRMLCTWSGDRKKFKLKFN